MYLCFSVDRGESDATLVGGAKWLVVMNLFLSYFVMFCSLRFFHFCLDFLGLCIGLHWLDEARTLRLEELTKH